MAPCVSLFACGGYQSATGTGIGGYVCCGVLIFIYQLPTICNLCVCVVSYVLYIVYT